MSASVYFGEQLNVRIDRREHLVLDPLDWPGMISTRLVAHAKRELIEVIQDARNLLP